MNQCNGISVFELLSKNRYLSASWSGDSINCIPTNDGVISTTRMMFDKISESKAVKLSDIGVDFVWKIQMSRVFDRGKAIEILQRYSKFSFFEGLKFLDGISRNEFQEMVSKNGYLRDSFFIGSIAGAPSKLAIILTARSLNVNVYLYFQDACSLFYRDITLDTSATVSLCSIHWLSLSFHKKVSRCCISTVVVYLHLNLPCISFYVATTWQR
ncbi:uncharacterized protein LOC113320527 isoform X1 [Papaver somniferum]|uniref:uncharacterized protein LOC113320527 isoform X1 n=1 Tax=Papaver somniferum TaxID=3469 RepID=UPI000E6FE723|nr:uncharacterized protein LOC113320527 isoform X1 [Papaver somniferum]